MSRDILRTRLDRLVGGRSAKLLRTHLDLTTVGDLVRYYPRRYADRGKLSDLGSLVVDEHATVLARVESAVTRDYRDQRTGRMIPRTEVVVTDGKGELRLTFFRQPYLTHRLTPGTVGLFAGKVTEFRGRRQLTHPDYTLLDSDVEDLETVSGYRPLIPVYPATAKVASWRIASCVEVVLDALSELPDPLPEPVRRERGLLDLRTALEQVHRPDSETEWREAHRRLRFEEAFVMQVVLAQRRRLMGSLPAVPRRGEDGRLLERFLRRLPFEPTNGQRRVTAEILDDLGREHPMHRLLQGEVGSGKTLVAVQAMLRVVDSCGQAALLAPTEVLAQQHYRSVTQMLGSMATEGMLGADDEATRVTLLTGSVGAKARREALASAASGQAGIVIGTHALLEEAVTFADLGLVVVDEQHRFGVEQRAALTAKAGFTPPHVLVMTATPIPRTVAMTVFGDLEVSTLRELPPGRSPISSSVVPATERPGWLDRAWERVREEVAAGHQVYVVCPRIGGEPDPGDVGDEDVEMPGRRQPLAVADVAAMLVDGPLAGLRVFMLHGRMPPEAKEDVMRRFAAGEVDVLVSTTVVEVGVDVANASVMVVMDAERFGVSQLHQLRGRVGRGSVPGLCLLVTDASADSPSRRRLEAIAATTDGFELSRLDLEQRREGDVLGAAQSGRRSSLRLLSVLRDEDVIADARRAADRVVSADPALESLPALAAEVAAMVASQQADYLDKA